eukprot:13940915-Alexandrium_andersonii.AAC.1
MWEKIGSPLSVGWLLRPSNQGPLGIVAKAMRPWTGAAVAVVLEYSVSSCLSAVLDRFRAGPGANAKTHVL